MEEYNKALQDYQTVIEMLNDNDDSDLRKEVETSIKIVKSKIDQ